MTAPLMLIIAMTTVTLVPGSVSTSAAQEAAGQSASKQHKGDMSKDASSRSAPKEGQMKKKRRSSGKQIIEETTTGDQPPSDPARSQRGTNKFSGTTAEFGSGGGGVAGATGK